MRMDYHLLHPALQYIKWIELHYIADGRTSSKETVDFIIGTDFEWNCVVISLTVIVIILSLKTYSIGFFECCYYHQCHYYFFDMNIIIILKIDIYYCYYYYYNYHYYYHNYWLLSLIVAIIVFFRTYPNALYCFLVKSRVVRLATTIDVQAKLLIRVNLSAHIVSYQVATTIAVRTCLSRSLLTLCITVILLYAFYIVSCTLSNKHFRVRVRVRYQFT